MRKFTAYILFTLMMVGTTAALFVPTATDVNLGSEFRNGQEYVYHILDEEGEEVENVLAEDAQDIAQRFRDRLDSSGVNTYNVTVEGNNQIRLQFATDSYKYDYITKYVNYSPVFTLATSDDTEASGEAIFNEKIDAKLVTVDGAPAITLPIKVDTTAWDNLLESAKTINENQPDATDPNGPITAVDHGPKRASDDVGAPGIFIWANKVEGETYKQAASGNDPRIANKVFARVNFGSNVDGKDMFYKDKDENKLLLRPDDLGFGNHQVQSIDQYTFVAKWMVNMLNADDYTYGTNNYRIEMKYDGSTGNVIVPPTTESLINYGKYETVAISTTLISLIVVFVLIALVFGTLFRLSAISSVTMTLTSVFFTFFLFVAFSIEFNVAAVIGLIVTTASMLFGQLIYLNKLKKEYASGKTLKKAHSEAISKSTAPMIDLSIVQILVGTLFFIIGGNYLLPFGVVLMAGGLMNAIFNLGGTRIMMWLLTNENALNDKPRLFGLDKPQAEVEKAKEEKETEAKEVELPVITKTAKKHGMKFALVGGILLLASAIGLGVFSALNDGNVLNNGNIYQQNSRLYIDIDQNNSAINSPEIVDEILKLVSLDESEKPIAYNETINHFTSVRYEDVAKDEAVLQQTINHYVVDLSARYDGTEAATFHDPRDGKTITGDLANVLSQSFELYDADVIVNIKTVHAVPGQPNSGKLIMTFLLATLLGAAYLMLRYRPSRGVSSYLISSTAGLITIGVMSLARIPSAPIILLSAIIVATLVQLMSIILMNMERDLIKEKKVKRLITEQKCEVMLAAISEFVAQGLPLILIPVVLAIPFIAIGPAPYSLMFLLSLLGTVLIGIPLLTLSMGPLSFHINRIGHKVYRALPKPKESDKKSKKQKKLAAEKRSAEPQEAIFIGINDPR